MMVGETTGATERRGVLGPGDPAVSALARLIQFIEAVSDPAQIVIVPAILFIACITWGG